MNTLAELFPREDYRFHLTLRRGELRDFFAPTAAHAALIGERRRWLADDAARYAALTPEGRPLEAEFAMQAAEWGLAAAGATVRELGALLEPDFLLLSPDRDGGPFRLRGGALCFPTGWALEEKLGRPLEEIHGAVPGLNPALGGPIQQFLTRLRPGPAYLRANWGLAGTAELNLHPSLARRRLQSPLDVTRAWLRVEYQALSALPRCGGVVFGIRIALYPLGEVLADPGVRAGFHQALASMPPALADYKGLSAVRADLLALSLPD